MITYTGSCHCQAVRLEVDAPADAEVLECNCSICRHFSYLHLIVPRNRFRLLCGEGSLSSYKFNTGIANHLFCSTCGVKSFYIPRSHPDAYSVNARCLDQDAPAGFSIRRVDGENWEANAEDIQGS